MKARRAVKKSCRTPPEHHAADYVRVFASRDIHTWESAAVNTRGSTDVVSPINPCAATAVSLQIAKEAGVPVVLDAGGQEGEISEDLLANIAVISPNETELMRMTGMPTDDEEQITAAAEVLFKKGVETVLCKLGSKGSLMLQSGGRSKRHPLIVCIIALILRTSQKRNEFMMNEKLCPSSANQGDNRTCQRDSQQNSSCMSIIQLMKITHHHANKH